MVCDQTTLLRSGVQAKNTANACAVVPRWTPQLGWKWPKDVFQSMNRALFCPAAWQEDSECLNTINSCIHFGNNGLKEHFEY